MFSKCNKNRVIFVQNYIFYDGLRAGMTDGYQLGHASNFITPKTMFPRRNTAAGLTFVANSRKNLQTAFMQTTGQNGNDPGWSLCFFLAIFIE
jgi:hypothetical protein